MTKHHLLALIFASIIPACAADEPDLVELQTGKADTWNTTPHGDYKFEETLNGAPSSGDLLTLSLVQNGAFRSTVSDELSGTTSHTGSYKLYQSSDATAFYIVLREGSQQYRYMYSIDVVDNATLWLEPDRTNHWYGMSSLGGDCTVSGCGAGETCNECFGDNVCLPADTDC